MNTARTCDVPVDLTIDYECIIRLSDFASVITVKAETLHYCINSYSIR